MYVKAMVSECDMDNTKYDKEVEGAHIVARSAVGRYCPVLYVGPEYLERKGIEPLSFASAYKKAEADIDVNGGSIDF
jgi:hypothetical protein